MGVLATQFGVSPGVKAPNPDATPLVPDGRIQGRWTQKWPSKISCGLGSQRPRKRPNSKFPNCGLVLTIIGKNWPKNLYQKFFTALFLMIWGVAGLRPNFFSSGRIFLAELALESWQDLAAVRHTVGVAWVALWRAVSPTQGTSFLSRSP